MYDFLMYSESERHFHFFGIFDFDPYHHLFQVLIICENQYEQTLFDDKGN